MVAAACFRTGTYADREVSPFPAPRIRPIEGEFDIGLFFELFGWQVYELNAQTRVLGLTFSDGLPIVSAPANN